MFKAGIRLPSATVEKTSGSCLFAVYNERLKEMSGFFF